MISEHARAVYSSQPVAVGKGGSAPAPTTKRRIWSQMNSSVRGTRRGWWRAGMHAVRVGDIGFSVATVDTDDTIFVTGFDL